MEMFRALLVADAERFSTHRDAELPDLHMEIRRVLAAACETSGLGETWENARFMESTGDGILAALRVEAIPALIDPFPRHLQQELAAAALRLRARDLQLRLRVALHYGLVDDERQEAPGISTATIDVCRLVDSDPLRDALKSSDPKVTFTAFMLSEELFNTYVAGGRTGLRESQFTSVEVKVKQYARPAYLRVPVSSTSHDTRSEAKSARTENAPVSPTTSISGVQITGDGTMTGIGNIIGGDFRQER